MEHVSRKEIEGLTSTANRLPDKQGKQLLDLISNWTEDARYARRVRYVEGVKFSCDQGLYFGKAKDISTSGIFIQTDTAIEAGKRLDMHLKLSCSPGPIEMSGTVVRQSPEGIAVMFNHENNMYADIIEALLSS